MKNLSVKNRTLLLAFGATLVAVGLSLAPLAVAEENDCECVYTTTGSGPCNSYDSWSAETKTNAAALGKKYCQNKDSSVEWKEKETTVALQSEYKDDQCHAVATSTFTSCENKPAETRRNVPGDSDGRGRFRDRRYMNPTRNPQRIDPMDPSYNRMQPTNPNNRDPQDNPPTREPTIPSNDPQGGSAGVSGGVIHSGGG